MVDRGAAFFLRTQNSDGGWGSGENTPSSIEETSLAVSALAAYFGHSDASERETLAIAVRGGAQWVADRTNAGSEFPASPIGLYFAKLWYFERDYPAIYCAAAMAGALRILPG